MTTEGRWAVGREEAFSRASALIAPLPLERRNERTATGTFGSTPIADIEGDNALAQEVEAVVSENWGRFSEQISRVEVRLSDENSDQRFGTEDRPCLPEARFVGLQPIAVSHRALTLEQAVDGDAEKLKRSLDSTLGRLGNRQWATHRAEGAEPSEYSSHARIKR